MGMSTHVIGLMSDESEIYQKHYKVMVACHEAGIKTLPKETADFFGFDYPDIYQAQEQLEVTLKVYKCGGEMEDGWEVIVSEIPEGVHKIRFINSY